MEFDVINGVSVAREWFNRRGVRQIAVARGGADGVVWEYADSHAMLRLLGVKRLPREGMAERLIGGVRVYVAPLVEGRDRSGFHKGWQGLRVMAICACGRPVPVGRLHQHKCKGVA